MCSKTPVRFFPCAQMQAAWVIPSRSSSVPGFARNRMSESEDWLAFIRTTVSPSLILAEAAFTRDRVPGAPPREERGAAG